MKRRESMQDSSVSCGPIFEFCPVTILSVYSGRFSFITLAKSENGPCDSMSVTFGKRPYHAVIQEAKFAIVQNQNVPWVLLVEGEIKKEEVSVRVVESVEVNPLLPPPNTIIC